MLLIPVSYCEQVYYNALATAGALQSLGAGLAFNTYKKCPQAKAYVEPGNLVGCKNSCQPPRPTVLTCTDMTTQYRVFQNWTNV